MASALEHLRILGAAGRPAGGASETAARHYARERLIALGFSVHEEAFEYSAFPGRMATPAVGIFLLLSIIATVACELAGAERIAAVVLTGGLILTGIFARRMLGDGVLDLPWMRRRAVNLVATREHPDPTVWLVAHLDSKSQPIPSVLRVVGVTVLAVAVVLAVIAATLAFVAETPRLLWWVVLALGALGAVPVMASVVGNDSDGAVDNASGVAAVLEASAMVTRGSPFGVLLPSAEELGLAGARAFARGRRAGVALNCDGVDDGGVIVLMYNGTAPARVIDALRDVARARTITAQVRGMPLGLLTDSTAFHAGGWEAVTVSHGSLRTLQRVHTRKDSLANLRGAALDTVSAVLAGAVERLTGQGQGGAP